MKRSRKKSVRKGCPKQLRHVYFVNEVELIQPKKWNDPPMSAIFRTKAEAQEAVHRLSKKYAGKRIYSITQVEMGQFVLKRIEYIRWFAPDPVDY